MQCSAIGRDVIALAYLPRMAARMKMAYQWNMRATRQAITWHIFSYRWW